uniref:PiggyBac transposable element-derived protein domain-containing protein n=1 Tax=Cuerna arida TaxID=1464854 RepID=A0A1B6F5V6_9HEMI
MLLSTAYKAGEQQKSRKRGNKVYITTNPKIIRKYNNFMGGVDGHDQMLNQYMGDHRSARLWKKITFNLLSRMILNSYSLYKQNTINTMTNFLVTLIESLSAEWFDVKVQRHPISVTDVSYDENQGGGDTGRLPSFFKNFLTRRKEIAVNVVQPALEWVLRGRNLATLFVKKMITHKCQGKYHNNICV